MIFEIFLFSKCEGFVSIVSIQTGMQFFNTDLSTQCLPTMGRLKEIFPFSFVQIVIMVLLTVNRDANNPIS